PETAKVLRRNLRTQSRRYWLRGGANAHCNRSKRSYQVMPMARSAVCYYRDEDTLEQMSHPGQNVCTASRCSTAGTTLSSVAILSQKTGTTSKPPKNATVRPSPL